MKKLMLSLALIGLCLAQAISQNQAIAFEHVNVVPMHTNQVLRDYTVVIRNNKIAEITPSNTISLPSNVKAIDARGKYLMPGLADMHIHDYSNTLERDFMLYLANGVTLVRNMSGSPAGIATRAKVRNGSLLAPHYFTSSPMIQSKGFSFGDVSKLPPAMQAMIKGYEQHMKPRIAVLNNTQDLKKIIEEQKKYQYDFIKVHDDFPKDLYLKLLKEAKKLGVPVIGHAQRKLPAKHTYRLKSIAHVEEFLHLFSKEQLADKKNYPKLAQKVLKTGVTVAPTLLTFEMIHRYVTDDLFKELLADPNMQYLPKPYLGFWSSDLQTYRARKWFGTPRGLKILERQFDIMKGLTKAFSDAGVPLISGTDVYALVLPGFSIHKELKLLVDAGLSPYAALKTVTLNIGTYLGGKYDGGSIKEGKPADLVLLDKNPLENIAHTQAIRGVVVKGKWLDRAALDQLLEKAKLN